jgi:hypothetical protein
MKENSLRVIKYEHVPLGIDYEYIFHFNDASGFRELDIITNDLRDGSLFYIVKMVDNAVYCKVIGKDVKFSPSDKWFKIEKELKEISYEGDFDIS